VVDCTATVSGQPMFANMLNAPVAKLSMGDEVDASKDLIDAGALLRISDAAWDRVENNVPCLPRGSSQKCSAQLSFPFRRAQLRATYPEGLR